MRLTHLLWVGLLCVYAGLRADNFPVISSDVPGGIATPGASVTLTATTSYTPVKYTWSHNALPIDGAAGATLSFAHIAVEDAGIYIVQVDPGMGGGYWSTAYALSVIGGSPVAGDRYWITPALFVFEPGQNWTLGIQGNGPLPYNADIKWYKDGVLLPTATQQSLNLGTLSAASAGVYSASVDGFLSSTGQFELNSLLPEFATQPISTYSTIGGSASFGASFALGIFIDSTQWYKDGIAIPGGTLSSFSIYPVKATDYGDYVLKATNNAGTTSTAIASLWPYTPPTITKQPASQVVAVGGTITLTVEATGAPELLPLTYAWQKDGGLPLPGANGATLTIANAQESDAGYYGAIVSGTRGPATSVGVPVTVGFRSPIPGAVSIVVQPSDNSVAIGQKATFDVVAGGSSPLAYQWKKAGVPIVGANDSEYTINAVSASDSAGYSVTVTNPSGTVDSVVVHLTIQDTPTTPPVSGLTGLPQVTAQPQSIRAAVGQTVTFSFTLSDDSPTIIEWQKDGRFIPDAANSPSLVLDHAQISDAGLYSAIISNRNGTVATATAQLSFIDAPTFQSQPVDTSVRIGDNLLLSVLAAGNPAPSIQWFKDNVALPNQLASTLLIPNVDAAAAGHYYAVASNTAGAVTSNIITVTIQPRSGLAGVYFGTFGENATAGKFGLVVRSNGTAILIGYLTGQNAGIEAEFGLLPDGSFDTFATTFLLNSFSSSSSDVASAAVAHDVVSVPPALHLKGQVTSLDVSGQVPDLSLAVHGQATSSSGQSAQIAGAYTASGADSSNHTLYSIISGDGRILVLDTAATGASAGFGSVSNDGSFNVNVGNGKSLQGTISGGASNVAGKIVDKSGTVTSFNGASSGGVEAVRLTNISTRGFTGSGDDVIIAGFIIQGPAPHHILIRAMGPGLNAYHVSGALSSPAISLFQGDNKLVESTLGGDLSEVVAAEAQVHAVPFSPNSKDAAIQRDLTDGAYTVQVRNTDGASGVVLVEVYDATSDPSQPANLRLANVSTRGRVGTGDQQMIAGFIVSGTAPKKVLIRAIGPTLKTFGVANVLASPRLEVHDSVGIIVANEGWGGSADIASAASKVNAFALANNSRDAATVATLAPGPYTVVVSGVGGSTGNALVEVYEVPE